jgi:hypothetical protein
MLDDTAHDLVIARLLTLLEDDWVPACALASFVYHSGVTAPPENRDICLALVHQALSRDWIRVGRLTPQFEAWDGPVAEVMRRLAGEAWTGDPGTRWSVLVRSYGCRPKACSGAQPEVRDRAEAGGGLIR